MAAGPTSGQAPPASAPDGVTRIDAVRFQGVTAISTRELEAVLSAWLRKDLTVPQMQHMAEIVTEHYRNRGYMVANAYVGAQTITDSTLTITVVEGRFGEVAVRSNTSAMSSARILRTFSENLCGRTPGCVGAGPIRADRVERAGLLVAEIPGVRTTYELAAGEEAGTTAIRIDALAAPRMTGSASADNNGFEYTGRERASAGFSVANLMGRGDLLTLSGSYSGKGFVSFAFDGSAPLGYGGARAGVTAGHTRYALGREFSVLDASGASDTVGLYIGYPLRRAMTGSADVRLDGVGKRMKSDFGALNFQGRQRAAEAILTFSASQADTLIRSGSTQVRLAATGGRLYIRDAATRGFDASTARTAGGFGKVAYSLRREDVILDGWTFFAGASGQLAFNNLDSSEKLGLSGPAAVRAYPTGAVAADTGTLATVETRLRVPQAWSAGHQIVVAPFYDHAWATFNHTTWAGYAGPRKGQLSGGGAYISIAKPGRYSLRATYAHRVDTASDVTPTARSQVWLEAAAAF